MTPSNLLILAIALALVMGGSAWLAVRWLMSARWERAEDERRQSWMQ